MKLYHCSANAIDWEPQDYLVAESESEAKEIFKQSLDEEDIWYSGTIFVDEVKIEGYKITVEKL